MRFTVTYRVTVFVDAKDLFSAVDVADKALEVRVNDPGTFPICVCTGVNEEENHK